MNNKANILAINLIVGILVILGGVFYMFNKNGLGLIIVTIGLLIEAILNWVSKIT